MPTAPLGACDLHVASGRVRLDRVDALQASIASGEVAVGHIAGRADIDGGAFDMRIGAVEGRVGMSSSGGRAWIGHAAADLELASAGCDFDIDRADGSVTARTASGAIRIGRMTHGRAKLTNGSGDIEVGIDEGATAHVDVEQRAGVGTRLRLVAGRRHAGDGLGPRPHPPRRRRRPTRRPVTSPTALTVTGRA